MWVEETKQGKYKFIERYTDPLTGKYRRVSIVLEKNTAQARKQAQMALQERIQTSLLSSAEDITLAQLFKLYCNEKACTLKKSSYSTNTPKIRAAIEIIGKDVLANKLTAGYIKKQLLSTGEKNITVNGRISKIKELLHWAYINDYINDISYLDKLKPLQEEIPRKQRIADKFLESEEVHNLINGIKIYKWKMLTKFLVLSGLRFGEAAALRRSDLDFKNRLIHVTKNYDTNNQVTSTPKTVGSNRDVYMQDELYVLCRKLYADSITAAIVVMDKDPLLFSDGGNQIKYNGYHHFLKRASFKILGRGITPHTLRHTHASLMLEAGMSVEAISRRMGHEDSKVTKEIYLHVTKRLQEKENQEIKGIKIL